uniref:Uncharacterized protein n=1 Tax=Vannella robusta TaxID=1487602 RepID=A0A7S4HQ99_9EUKA|mmetsp:Transcript_14135/g.17855  ORF Transcript_14135/g.17855 Transcript_14135/m.17855 type:complete len:102 (+) Transcript_14135:3-308(+)
MVRRVGPAPRNKRGPRPWVTAEEREHKWRIAPKFKQVTTVGKATPLTFSVMVVYPLLFAFGYFAYSRYKYTQNLTLQAHKAPEYHTILSEEEFEQKILKLN